MEILNTQAYSTWERSWIDGPEYDETEPEFDVDEIIGIFSGETDWDSKDRGFSDYVKNGLVEAIDVAISDSDEALKEVIQLILKNKAAAPNAYEALMSETESFVAKGGEW